MLIKKLTINKALGALALGATALASPIAAKAADHRRKKITLTEGIGMSYFHISVPLASGTPVQMTPYI